MEIVLIRHGATDWNLEGRCQGATDRELSAAGIRQAEEIARRLGVESFQAIYSSSLRRARQTAEFIGQRHDLPVLVEHDLRELDHGQLEGLTFLEIKERYGEFLARWRSEPADLRVPGGERLSDVAERAWKVLHKIVARHSQDARLAVVSHNFPIVGIACRISGTDLNSYRTFHLDPCGVTRLEYVSSGAWTLTHVNGRSYALPAARDPELG
jgi:broad specificity phosphatase PhoE